MRAALFAGGLVLLKLSCGEFLVITIYRYRPPRCRIAGPDEVVLYDYVGSYNKPTSQSVMIRLGLSMLRNYIARLRGWPVEAR